jgi:hypothetical protein
VLESILGRFEPNDALRNSQQIIRTHLGGQCRVGIGAPSTIGFGIAICWVPAGSLWVIGFCVEIGEKQRLAAGLLASTSWFDGYKDGVDLCQHLRVIELQNPTLL